MPLTVLIVGMFMSILDISIVNVAIPTIQNDFGVTTDDVQWVVTAYTLALGVVVPVTAWLGDRFGLTRVYNLALLTFAAGSALCGLAWDLNSLVVFRIIQAIPGGILPVMTMTMLFRIVPREKLGAAMGLYGVGVVFAPAIGPTLGGYLVEYVDWRLIFFINVPVGILGVIAAVLVLPQFSRVAGRRFDVLGFITIAAGLFSLLLALSEGESWGWTGYRVLGLLTISALCLALFVVIELEVDDPLLDVRIFRYWAFTHSLLLISVLMVVMFGVLFYIPLFLQQAQGWGALDAGLTLLPQALVMGMLMPIAGRIYDRFGARWPATIGLAIVAVSTYQMHYLTIDSPREHIMWLLVLQGAGLGMAMMPIFTGGVAVIPQAEVGTASAYNNVVQRVAGALGLAVLTAILTTQQAQLLAGRAGLVPAGGVVPPQLGPPGTPDWVGTYAMYQRTQLEVFVSAIDNLFLIAAVLSAIGSLGSLFLRAGSTAALVGATPPQQEAAAPPRVSAASSNGGPAQSSPKREFVPSATATAARQARPARTSGS
ncbi:MAG: DHA2 family efflux MFS transporter permease subunit [Pseudonocardiaceae bacterium]